MSRHCHIAAPAGKFGPERVADLGLCWPRIVVMAGPLDRAGWQLVRAFARNTRRDDIRLRFGHALNLYDEDVLKRTFDVKVCGEMAWLLDRHAAIAGLAHRARVSPSEAEIALLVRSDVKRTGIGEALLRDALRRSLRDGFKTASGLILHDNRAMLRLARKIGFETRRFSGPTVELALDLSRYGDGAAIPTGEWA